MHSHRAPALLRAAAVPAMSADEVSDCGRVPAVSSIHANRGRRGPPHVNDVVSSNCSPVLKPAVSPAVSGIFKLRHKLEKLEALSLDTSRSRLSSLQSSVPPLSDGLSSVVSSEPSVGSRAGSRDRILAADDDDSKSDITTTYDVNLEHDFASESMHMRDARPGPDTGAGISRLSLDVDLGPIGVLEMDGVGDAPLAQRQDAPAKMTADEFEQLRCLGTGSYGTVILVKQRSTGRLFAQKQFKKAKLRVHKKLVEQTKTERQILESVNRHPFVVKLYYAFQDCEKLYLILEYGMGGELFTHLSSEKMFSEPVAAFYMAEMALALLHLHEDLSVVYRDLKPENCLLDAEGHLLLTDFGLSKVAVGSDPHDESCGSMAGTVEYMAPEVILGKRYGKAVDWWSFGALGFDLITGAPPFRGQGMQLRDKIVKKKFVLPYFVSPDASDLLTRLLRKDPAKRLGGNMPRDASVIKKHRFFRKIDWARLERRQLDPPIRPVITDPELAENFSNEFTDMALSPVISPKSPFFADDPPAAVLEQDSSQDDLFGGFSFVAPSSLLEKGGFI